MHHFLLYLLLSVLVGHVQDKYSIAERTHRDTCKKENPHPKSQVKLRLFEDFLGGGVVNAA